MGTSAGGAARVQEVEADVGVRMRSSLAVLSSSYLLFHVLRLYECKFMYQ